MVELFVQVSGPPVLASVLKFWVFDDVIVIVMILGAFGCDFAVGPGEFVAIMGPSGSGKSTLMNMIGCLDVPSAGSYMLDGVEVASLPASPPVETISSNVPNGAAAEADLALLHMRLQVELNRLGCTAGTPDGV